MEEENVVCEEKKADEVKKVVLGKPCEIHETTVPAFEVDIPDVVLTRLGVNDGDSICFFEEDGRVYLEKV